MGETEFLRHFDNVTTSPTLSSLEPASSFSEGPATYVLMSLFTLVNVLAVVGNVLILRVIPSIPYTVMEDSSKVFYKCLALTDTVAALTYIIGIVFGIFANGARLMVLCKVIGFVMTTFPGSSVLQLALLNTDRYLFIVKPMIYSRFVSRKVAVIACVTSITFIPSLLFMFVLLNEISFDILRYHSDLRACIVDFQEETFLPFSLCMFVMPWSVMVGLTFQYIHIFIISASHFNRIKPQKRSCENIKIPVKYPEDGNSAASSAAPSTSDPVENGINTEQVIDIFRHPSRREIYEEAGLNNMTTRCSSESPVEIISNRPSICWSGTETLDKHPKDSSEELGADRHCCENHMRDIGAPSTSHGSTDKHHQHHHHLDGAGKSSTRQGQRSILRQNLRVLRTPLIITSCYFFSFLPPTFLNMYISVKGQTIDSLFHAMFTMLVALNGCVNIIVYYFTIKPFRQILKDMLRRR